MCLGGYDRETNKERSWREGGKEGEREGDSDKVGGWRERERGRWEKKG